MGKKIEKMMNAIEAAFKGLDDGANSKEYKRFIEDLRLAGENALRTHTSEDLKTAKRELEDAEYARELVQAKYDKAKAKTSDEELTEAFKAALVDCKKKGPEKTFQDVCSALNPYKNEEELEKIQAELDKADKIVEEKRKIVEYNEKVIEVIKLANERLFNTEVSVKVDTEDDSKE